MYVLAGAVGVVVLWWGGAAASVGPGAELMDAGRLVGLLAGYVALVQVLLRSRVPAIARPLGMRRVNATHRLLGGYLVVLVVGHAALITAGYAAASHVSFLHQFGALFTGYPWVWASVVGAALLVAASAVSVPVVRRRLRYGVWHVVHLLVYPALVLAFLHQVVLGEHFVHGGVLRAVWIALFIGVGVVVLYGRLRPAGRKKGVGAMKRWALLVAGTAAVVALLVTVRPHHSAVPRRPAALGSAPPTAIPTLTAIPTSTGVASSSPPPPRYRAGTVTGPVVSTDYGTVRVRVTAAHGRIVRVEALELPHLNSIDTVISRPAAKVLAREVVRVQSAAVDAVSGATYTSEGYLSSLQAALDRLS